MSYAYLAATSPTSPTNVHLTRQDELGELGEVEIQAFSWRLLR